MDERYIASIDLGTYKIALAVARVEDNDVQVIFYDEAASEGIRYGSVFNPNKVAVPLEGLIRKAEKELGIRILQVGVGLPRFGIKQQIAKGEVPRTDTGSSITKEEIDNLKNMALDNYPLEDESKEMIYCAIPQSFTTDDYHQGIESDIIGMISDKLEGNFKIFIGNRSKVNYIDKIFNDLGIAIGKTYFVPEVTAEIVLSNEERENGVALIDFGAGVTSVCVYQNGILRHFGSIPFGGSTITNDIKLEGNFSNKLSENIKIAYGACMPDKLASISEKIIRVMYKESGMEKDLGVRYLSEIITCREKEIIDAILYEIQRSGFADFLRSGIVITGGGAEMANLGNYIKELSGYNVRIGYPMKLFSADGCYGVFEASATACLGMMMAVKKDNFNCAELVSEPQEETLAFGVEEQQELFKESPVEVEEKEDEDEEPVLEMRAPEVEEKRKQPAQPRKKTSGNWKKVKDIFGDLFNGMDLDE